MSDNENISAEVNTHVFYGTKKIKNVTVILTNTYTKEEYTATTNNTGDCTIEITTSDEEFLLTDYLVEVGCENYSININTFTVTGLSNELVLYLVKLDDCQNQILTTKNCKYFHHDPYMTPNNFDLYFDPNQIPTNIITEPPHELLLRLQKHLPLTKILHLNLDAEQNTYSNVLHLNTSVKLKFNTRDKFITNSNLKIIGVWGNYTESEQVCSKSYEVVYLYDTSIPLKNTIVTLTNVDYPLIKYSGITDEEGKCTIQVPYGVYYQQLKTEEYLFAPTRTEINQEEESTRMLLGAVDEDYNIDFSEFTVRIIDINKGESGIEYNDGVLDSELLNSGVGVLEYDDTNIDYRDGVLIVFTGEVVDTVVLNSMNNYTVETSSLPIFEEGTNNKIYYMVGYDKNYCNVIIDDIEYIGLEKNEVVLL